MSRRAALYCSFCGKSQHEVFQLIVGPPFAHICDECVDLCAGIVAERRKELQEKAETQKNQAQEKSDG